MYEKNRNRRKGEFRDLDYICCSTFGRARSKGFHKQLLAENGLPDIRWHDLRSTYCTLLLKETEIFKKELLEIVADVIEFFPDTR